MDNFYELASARRSIRKYTEEPIPDEDVAYFIKAAVTAPSGCDSQCWRFVAIRDRAVLDRIAETVVRRTEELVGVNKPEAGRVEGVTEQYLASKRKMVSFFTKAPVVIAVFMTRLDFYDPVEISALEAAGYGHEDIMRLFADADVLSIGAAVQNLLLAVHEKGYGACWMNEPAVAGSEIGEILGVPQGCRFMSLIPIGVPAYTPRKKELKPMDEIFSTI